MVQERIQKLQNLRDQGIDPYPAKYQRTHSTKDAKALLETIELNGEDPKTSSAENVISIAGRILAMRSMGRATFIDIQDGDGKIQTMFRSNALGSLYDMLRDLDIGDWIGIEGSPIRTRTGEATVLANSFTVGSPCQKERLLFPPRIYVKKILCQYLSLLVIQLWSFR